MKQKRQQGHKERQKMRTKLIVTAIAMLSAISLIAVGVVASTTSYNVQIENTLNVDLDITQGNLTAKRTGDVVYYGTTQKASTGWLDMYTASSGENTENVAELKKKINLPSSEAVAKLAEIQNSLKISYTFNFKQDENSTTGTHITVTPQTPANSYDGRVKLNLKYYFGTNEPSSWDAVANTISGDGIIVGAGEQVYVLAELEVDITKSIKFSGLDWGFDIGFKVLGGTTGGMLDVKSVAGASSYEVWVKKIVVTKMALTVGDWGGLQPLAVGDTDTTLGSCIWTGSASSVNIANLITDSGVYLVSVVAKDTDGNALETAGYYYQKA